MYSGEVYYNGSSNFTDNSSFTGSFGFAALYNLHGKKLWTAGLGGLISWAVYLAVQVMIKNNFLINMFAAMAATIYAEMMARTLKTPATIFLISSIIPLVPGGNLYYTMNYAIAKDWKLFYLYGTKDNHCCDRDCRRYYDGIFFLSAVSGNSA